MSDVEIAAGTEAVLIAGPTASGKSRLAVELARRLGGIVINADSMQVYGELRILSARPSAEEESAVPHRLYGHVAAGERYSVGRWLVDVGKVMEEARGDQAIPVIVGGTGLYFKALTEGLATVPPIPPAVREYWRSRGTEEAAENLHAALTTRDPEGAASVRPSDKVRIIRALEVIDGTGRSLDSWQRQAGAHSPLVTVANATCIVMEPDRPQLHERIGARADHMVGAGVLDEVRRLATLGLDRASPAMKAIGVREFVDHLAGKLSLEEAVTAVKTETRRYAKRQSTWFRNQMPNWPRRAV
jgi:tRNA dimethylallyltransferase